LSIFRFSSSGRGQERMCRPADLFLGTATGRGKMLHCCYSEHFAVILSPPLSF